LEGVEGVAFEIGLGVDEEVELSLLDVHLVFEETGHVGHVFEEGRPHKRFLADQARNLGYLIDEIQDAGRNVDNLTAHDLEELPKQLAGLLDEVDSGDLLLPVLVSLSHQELLHLYVVVLAEKLQESKSTAQCQLVVQLSLDLELIGLMSEHLYQHSLLFIKQVVRVHNFV
jgi:hypothetical protein